MGFEPKITAQSFLKYFQSRRKSALSSIQTNERSTIYKLKTHRHNNTHNNYIIYIYIYAVISRAHLRSIFIFFFQFYRVTSKV